MQYQSFVLKCDFEIGDHVRLLENTTKYTIHETLIIIDIMTISSLKNKETFFSVLLADQYNNELQPRLISDIIMVKPNVRKKSDLNRG